MAQNLTSGSPFFQSAFTNNGIPFGWTVEESTFLNAANTNVFGGALLSTYTFNCLSLGGCGAPAFNPLIALGNHGALFAATDEFVISATGAGSSLSTINLNSAVPEASTWAMILVGFGSMGFVAYRQKRRQTVFRVA